MQVDLASSSDDENGPHEEGKVEATRALDLCGSYSRPNRAMNGFLRNLKSVAKVMAKCELHTPLLAIA